MASPDLFALSHSAFNPFLYADIGPQYGATSLTIASLFGRCGCDPWEEAARLARLPVAAATASLAAMIAAVPMGPCSLQEATALAARLVALLPRPNSSERLAAGSRLPRLPPGLLPTGPLAIGALALGLLVALALAWTLLSEPTGARPQEEGGRSAEPVTQELRP